jgi:hypothetical protein
MGDLIFYKEIQNLENSVTNSKEQNLCWEPSTHVGVPRISPHVTQREGALLRS